ncbi:glucosyl-dolichyl phosphate glucuronosyltransferase [Halorientalis regularis]|jgi:glycosyltransferase involved in cell wall biosynthesis|uniref:Glycosyltransferase, GT2 family n=1 Tax=Halorientalis regularis TaxID=660518 RepID=A0A1G7FY89_9EURY|nr:glucosyl-dolichyl phosphate glucuronosyltransferase [Halorientalis regularis]SDE80800.1 Glycosyltransferase, GT2 family [Halorientalis regularis]
MRVSVVLCTHTLDRYETFTEAAHSVLEQTHDDTELVLVSDGSEAVYERFRTDFGDREDVLTHCNDENVGLLESRNNGAEVATGDVVAFIDDDAVADEDWVAQLVEAYEYRDAVAAGGKMTPEWVAGRPTFLPEEFYFLVGVTQRGFADGPGEVRNTFGSNISFRRDVFLDLDGFDTDIGGRKGDENLQGGETELCARLREAYDAGVYYNPDARVAHKVFEYRTDPTWLLDRAFWQGYSKRGMEVLVPESTGEEYDFLGQLLGEFVPQRLRGLVAEPSREKALQFVMLFVFTAAVGFGYLYGATKWR